MTITQKELKTIYQQELKNYWKDEKMVKHCIKEAGYIVELEDQNLLSVEKPSIKKDFCFGYSDSMYDTEDYDRANKAADYASKSESYFIEANLKEIKRTLESLNSDKTIWVFSHYHGQEKNSKLFTWSFENHYHDMSKYQNARILTDNERQRLIEGYKEVEKDFIKRLNTYLKKYGMTKVNTWSYWRDA